MRRPLLLLLLTFLISVDATAQWEKYPIVGSGFKDSAPPQWGLINGDNLNDLVGYDNDSRTLFFRKNGGSDLEFPTVISENLAIRKYQIVDWENDGDMDIVAHLGKSVGNEQFFQLFLNNSNGTFIDSEIEIYSEQFNPDFTLFSDLNNDGANDIIFQQSGNYYIYTNNNGSYEYSNHSINGSLKSQLYAVDLNQDGKEQIVVVNDDFTISIYDYSSNDLNLTQTVLTPFFGNQDYSTQSSLQFNDIDKDGDLDITRKILDNDLIVVGDVGNIVEKQNYFFQHVQNDDESFSTSNFYTSQSLGEISHTIFKNKTDDSFDYYIYDAGLKNFQLNNGVFQSNLQSDEDIPNNFAGTLDATCIFQTNADQLYTTKRNGAYYDLYVAYQSLTPEQFFQWERCLNCSALESYDDIELSDLDGDGDLDIIVSALDNDNQIVWFENFREGCHFDNINPIVIQFFEETADNITVESADFDNDGDMDIVVKQDVENAGIYIIENDGAGNFSQPTFLTTIPHAIDLYAEDLYNDGFAEIILHTGEFSFTTQDPTTFSVTILDNKTGIENFENIRIQNSTDSGEIEFADMDNDGDTDMVVFNDDSLFDNVVIYENNGTQMIQSQIHEDFLDMFSFNIFDYNKDNYPDILAYHDGLTNNNISSIYNYQNTQGTIDWTNPNFVFENIARYKYYGIHNQDLSIHFVGRNGGFGSNAILSYYNQSGIADTLDANEPIKYLVGDLNNDGYDDIINANTKGSLDFYTRGLINCDPPCVPDTDGYLFFQDCDGVEFFVIETAEGELLDPYFADGVQFVYYDGMYVRFSFVNLGISTPCEDARTVEIQCIEEVLHIPQFTDYDWLPTLINEADGCCQIEKIESFYNINTRYIYVTPRSDCPQFRETLYTEDDILLCFEPEVFVGQCIAEFGLDTLTRKTLWECDPVSTQDIEKADKILIYPNPSQDIFNIETITQGQLKIYDTQGKCVQLYDHIPTSINLQDLSEGVYILSFGYKDQVITKRVVKM